MFTFPLWCRRFNYSNLEMWGREFSFVPSLKKSKRIRLKFWTSTWMRPNGPLKRSSFRTVKISNGPSGRSKFRLVGGTFTWSVATKLISRNRGWRPPTTLTLKRGGLPRRRKCMIADRLSVFATWNRNSKFWSLAVLMTLMNRSRLAKAMTSCRTSGSRCHPCLLLASVWLL